MFSPHLLSFFFQGGVITMHRFKLEALLNHRLHQEDICQKELAETERLLADEKGKLRRWKKEKRNNIQTLQIKQKEKINVSDIVLSVNYIQRLSEKIEVQKQCIREATRKVNQKRQELIIIVKKRKTLEKLKEKDLRAYQQKMMQNERKFMDEVASTRNARKR
jgi:flagellar FliJ protein